MNFKVSSSHCRDFYGSNLWNFSSKEAQKVFNLWNYSVRDIYNLPRMSRTYIIENLLSIHHGFKVDLMSHFQKFYRSLYNSPSLPVRILATMLRTDVRSVTGQNLAMITAEAKVDLWQYLGKP